MIMEEWYNRTNASLLNNKKGKSKKGWEFGGRN